MRDQLPLDLRRHDVEAAADDHFALASADREVPVAVEAADVPGRHPAVVVERLAVAVADEPRRQVSAAHPDLTVGSRWQVLTALPTDLNGDAGDDTTDGSRAASSAEK